jgi:hypothetical protein
MTDDKIIMIYNPLNLPIDKFREYNVEKYHFLSTILDILVYHQQVKKKYDLTADGIFRHFQEQNLMIEKEREKFNLAIAQLKGSGMIDFTDEGIIGLTNKGLDAYDSQIFHSIAANIYTAERSNHLAKVAIIAASLLSVISIVCSIIIGYISNT